MSRQLRTPVVIATGLLALALAYAVFAAVPTFWRMESQADFLRGDTDGVSIDSDGTIALAPAASVLSESTEPHFWSLAIGQSGEVYAGSGNDGKIYRVDGQGQESVLTDTNELQVHALAVDARGNVYAGTSPRGVVYRIDDTGSQEVFFDPEDRYIWALALDSTGNLIVATGDKAQIHRVRPSGESEVMFTSEEMHIISLALDADDNIYAGTESNGLVLKVDRGGATSVLFDTPFQEVRALVLDTRGNVYAATVNGGGRATPSAPASPPETTTPTSTTTSTGETVTVTTTATAAVVSTTPASTSSASSASMKGGLYRIAPDGSGEQLWQSSEDTPLSMALGRDDRLLVGTGNEGRVFLVEQDKTSSLLLSVDADQVTAIRPAESGQSFLVTSNPAKVYRVNAGRRTEGIYQSEAKDTGTISSWGRIRWEARVPSGTAVEIQTRSGNSAEPDNTWSAWSKAYVTSTGEQMASPRARFLQWRAVLKSTGELTPELLDVTAIYLQQNLAPEVSLIEIHPPGKTFQKPIVATGQVEILGMNGSPVTDGPGTNGSAAAATAPNVSLMAMSRPLYHKGIQTVTWDAKDSNEDDLSFDVFYRVEGENLWRLLREDLTEPVIAWDTVAMPDGRYYLKVVASDEPSNPAEVSRTGERVSRSFEVDNTPPRITALSTTATSAGHQVQFEAEDDISAIRAVEYSVNSGHWTMVFPTDGIADSLRESFQFEIEGYREGAYTLVVKVTDSLGNTATARAELR